MAMTIMLPIGRTTYSQTVKGKSIKQKTAGYFHIVPKHIQQVYN